MLGEICQAGLAHALTEAEKSHDLLSAGWRPGKAGGVVPVQMLRPADQESDGVSPSPKARGTT